MMLNILQNAQDYSPITKKHLAQNVSSGEAEKSCCSINKFFSFLLFLPQSLSFPCFRSELSVHIHVPWSSNMTDIVILLERLYIYICNEIRQF